MGTKGVGIEGREIFNKIQSKWQPWYVNCQKNPPICRKLALTKYLLDTVTLEFYRRLEVSNSSVFDIRAHHYSVHTPKWLWAPNNSLQIRVNVG